MGEIKNKIHKLSCRLNEMLRYGIKSDEYDEVLRLS
ncbi:hypothetical protein EDD71_10210 [Fonticella tunisiensis]|uniref:Spo0E like sporulation regulatory protein n=1 Tax=Fonticella tunisiensis TaxID=1096341 RepID=A0A4R7KUS5_9CLOT|nr:hypothetical protein EDD71_10210 [Fonticella tunisiensis]